MARSPPSLAALVAVAVLLGVEAGPVVLAVALAALAVALVVWWRAHPGTFHRVGGPVLLGLWRSFWAYGVRWRTAMMLSGLGGRFNGDEYVPRAVRVRAGRFADRVTVRMVVGQQSEDWSRRLGALAHGFGARVVQVVELPADPATSNSPSGASTPSPTPSPCPHRPRSTWALSISGAAKTANPGPCAYAGHTPSHRRRNRCG